MSFWFKFLLIGVLVCIVGFIFGAFLHEKKLGMIIFFSGFFIGAISAIFIIVFRSVTDLHDINIGLEIQIAAIGFCLIVIGQLTNSFLESEHVFWDILYFVGLVVMLIGIVMAVKKRLNN